MLIVNVNFYTSVNLMHPLSTKTPTDFRHNATVMKKSDVHPVAFHCAETLFILSNAMTLTDFSDYWSRCAFPQDSLKRRTERWCFCMNICSPRISLEICPNSPSADLNSALSKRCCFGVGVHSLNRDMIEKPRVRERQSEEEEVSRRPQYEQTEKSRDKRKESYFILEPMMHLYVGAHSVVFKRQQTKVIRSFINMLRHTRFCTHTSSHQTANSAD